MYRTGSAVVLRYAGIWFYSHLVMYNCSTGVYGTPIQRTKISGQYQLVQYILCRLVLYILCRLTLPMVWDLLGVERFKKGYREMRKRVRYSYRRSAYIPVFKRKRDIWSTDPCIPSYWFWRSEIFTAASESKPHHHRLTVRHSSKRKSRREG